MMFNRNARLGLAILVIVAALSFLGWQAGLAVAHLSSDDCVTTIDYETDGAAVATTVCD